MEKYSCPIADKFALTLEEASSYFGIGTSKLRSLTDEKQCEPYVLWNGTKRLIKRRAFEQYLEQLYSI